MQKSSIFQDLNYNPDRPSIKVMIESDFTKEIRIAFKAGQVMQEHKTAYPIVVEIVEGSILFGVSGKTHPLQKGDIIALEGNTPHDLKAEKDSIVRLTLFIADNVERVRRVVMP